LDIRNYSGANAIFYVNGAESSTTRIVYTDTPPGRVGVGIAQNGGMVTQFTLVPVTK
jgi:hypothetical protein